MANASLDELRSYVETEEECLSIERQCALLGVWRSSYYYQTRPEREENLVLMRLLDEQILETLFYGVRRLHQWLVERGYHGLSSVSGVYSVSWVIKRCTPNHAPVEVIGCIKSIRIY